VTVLFQLTQPTNAYVGQKDYQQALIIQRLARDLHLPLRVHIRPTVREADGLAMSSRNVYLTAAQRRQAAGIVRALAAGRARIQAGARHADPVLRHMRRRLDASIPHARVDYLAIVDARTLIPHTRLTGRVALLVALWIGSTRLIDNLLVDVP
jgi:pantoate--beta-alanine ligase